MKQPARLLVATGGFPPTLAGSSILMDNLFKSYKGEVKVIAHYYPSVDKTFLPPCRTIRVKPPLVRIRFFQRCWQGLRKTRLGRWLVYRFVRCQVARYKPDVIMVHCRLWISLSPRIVSQKSAMFPSMHTCTISGKRTSIVYHRSESWQISGSPGY